MHHVEVAHVQQHALRAHVLALGRKLHEVDAYGQSLDGHRVLQNLVVGLSHVAARHRLLRAVVDDEPLQFLVVLIVVGIQFRVALDVHARYGHRQPLAVHELAHLYAALRVRQLNAVANVHRKRGKRQLVLGVAQDVHARPCSPVLQGVVDVVHLLLGRGILGLVHEVVALNGQFAALLQVLILRDERVDGLQILRLAHLVDVSKAVLLCLVVGTDAGSATVLVVLVPVVQQLILLGLESQHMQQVAAEDVAVGPLHECGLVALCRLFSQLFHGFHRLPIIVSRQEFIFCLVGVVGTKAVAVAVGLVFIDAA